MNKDLENDSVSSLLVKLSIPAIVSMLIAAIYNIVDRIFVGQSDPLGLTAIGITMPFQVMQMAFVLLIGIGGSTLISIKNGEKDYDGAERLLSSSLVLIVITQILVTAVCLIFLDPLFSLLGVSESVYKLAKDYIVIILMGGAPGLTGYCLNNTVRSLGFAKPSMYIVFISSVINIVLDFIFIYIFKWGVRGAAIATLISQTIVTVYVIYFFLKNKDTHIKLRKGRIKLTLEEVKDIALNGLPNFYMQIFGTLVAVVLNRSIIHYGSDYQLASVTIISSISLFVTMIIYGIGQGAQPLIGYNFGAKRYERVEETVKLSLMIMLTVSLSFLVAIEVFPHVFTRMFTSQRDLLEITNKNIRIYLLGIPFIACHSLATTFLQSTKQPRSATILYVLRYGGILLPAIYLIPRFLGVDGVYISNAVSDIGSGLVALVYLAKSLKKLSKGHRIANLDTKIDDIVK